MAQPRHGGDLRPGLRPRRWWTAVPAAWRAQPRTPARYSTGGGRGRVARRRDVARAPRRGRGISAGLAGDGCTSLIRACWSRSDPRASTATTMAGSTPSASRTSADVVGERPCSKASSATTRAAPCAASSSRRLSSRRAAGRRRRRPRPRRGQRMLDMNERRPAPKRAPLDSDSDAPEVHGHGGGGLRRHLAGVVDADRQVRHRRFGGERHDLPDGVHEGRLAGEPAGDDHLQRLRHGLGGRYRPPAQSVWSSSNNLSRVSQIHAV